MVLRRAIRLGVVAAAVLLAAQASDAAGAAPVKLSGTLKGTRLPAPATGVSLVQALNLSDGTLAAADYADRRGRFSLKVPPGPYALTGGSVFYKRGLPTVKLLAALRARAGKPRRLSLSPRAGRSATSHIVGVPYFSGAEPFQNRGLAAMVETDLVQLRSGPPCAFTVVEVQRRDEVIREIRLQQTEFFDPATRVRPGHLLQPQLLVKGSLAPQAGGDLSYTIQVVDARSGAVKGATSGQIPESAFITASEGIAHELAKILCDETPLYLGQVNGTLRIDAPPGCVRDHEQYSYNASLAGFSGAQDPFAILSGGGGNFENDTGAKAYGDSGSGSYTLDPCEETQSPGCSVEMGRASDQSTGQLLFEREGSTVKATVLTFGWEGVTSGPPCGRQERVEQVIGEGTFPASMVGAQTITVALSRHEDTPRVTDGSGTLTLQRVD